MKVISVNVGKAQEKEWLGKQVSTGIFKHSVETSQWVSLMGMKGDEQADMKHHGGINKAVYSYDMAYYTCLLYTSPSPRDRTRSRMPSSA